MNSPVISFIYFALAIGAGAVAFMRPELDATGNMTHARWRRLVQVGLMAGFIPLIVMAWFSRFPQHPVRFMPIGMWASIEREYWMPFGVLFFACACHLVTPPNRKMLRALVAVLTVFVIAVTGWRLFPVQMYQFGRNMQGGVCLQSSGYTCGAASLVTMLNELGIDATEGEMARLSGTIPGRGVSDFQAAYALQQKLSESHRPERAQIIFLEDRDPSRAPTPFLAGMKFSFFFDHMVCVLRTDGAHVEIGDPLEGRRTLPRDVFVSEWRGFAITAAAP